MAACFVKRIKLSTIGPSTSYLYTFYWKRKSCQ